MVFVVRVRDSVGMHRLVFGSAAGSTWLDLQQQVADVTHVPVALQRLARTPQGAPTDLPSGTSLQAAGLANGDVLHLSGHTQETLAAHQQAAAAPAAAAAASSSSSAAPAPPAHALTSRCNHGPRGACPHCLGVEPGMENKVQGKCNHPAGATCLHCSAGVAAQSKELAPWLCTHPDSVFCPKCIPKESEEERLSHKLACDCDRAKGQECSRCLVTQPTIKVDKIPFARFLDEKRALCKYKHGAGMSCAMCIPPTLPTFLGKKTCDKGHQPWPHGVCLSCAPPNATIREQPYRHCDSISIFPSVIQPFYASWMRSGSVFQRAAILFGRYQDEPAETNNPGAIRAVVHCLYEPPQENAKDFVRFLKDQHEHLIHDVSSRLGLEVVGWLLTTAERKGEKYGGNVVLSGLEVQQAARFQHRYKNALGYSRFVTVVMEHAATVEPKAYQVSDLAVCLERDNVFAKAADPNMICARVPNAGEMSTTVVFKDRPLLPGKEFLPDEFIVKVAALAPKSASECLFAHADFPPLKDNPTDAMLSGYMTKYRKEAYLTKLADFNLLAYMASKNSLPQPVLQAVAAAIANKTQLAKETLAALDSAFAAKAWV